MIITEGLAVPELPPADYDGAWKEALDRYFRPFLEICFPLVAAVIEWERGIKFLDQELQSVVRDAELGKQRVDKLVEVTCRDGSKQFLYIHVEVQSQRDPDLALRLYQYHCRLTDRYGSPVITLVVLGDESPNWKPEFYSKYRLDCGVRFDFLVCKLLELEGREDQPLKSDNPIALTISAHLVAKRTRGNMELRTKEKWELTRRLYSEGYSKADILELFRHIDLLIPLAKDQQIEYLEQVYEYEQQAMTPHITSTERYGLEFALERGRKEGIELGVERGREEGMERGREEGIQRGREEGIERGREEGIERGRTILRDLIVETLEDRFGNVPDRLSDQLEAVEDTELLKRLQHLAMKCSQLEDFSVVEVPSS